MKTTTNKEFSNSGEFSRLCLCAAKRIIAESINMPFKFENEFDLTSKLMTTRQASKYRRGTGIVRMVQA